MGFTITLGKWDQVGEDGRVVAPSSPMGSKDEVTDKILEALPEAAVDEEGYGGFEIENLIIEFNGCITTKDGEVLSVIAQVMSFGEPAEPSLEKICDPNGWSAVDDRGATIAGKWKP